MSGPSSPAEHLQMVEDCEARESRLVEWEVNFLASIRTRLEGGGTLTFRQAGRLDEVWERATARG